MKAAGQKTWVDQVLPGGAYAHTCWTGQDDTASELQPCRNVALSLRMSTCRVVER